LAVQVSKKHFNAGDAVMILLACLAYIIFRLGYYFFAGVAIGISERLDLHEFEMERQQRAQAQQRAQSEQAQRQVQMEREQAVLARQRYALYLQEKEREKAILLNKLKVLNLNYIPLTSFELKKARNDMLLKVHPDLGGNNAMTMQVNDVYNQLVRDLGFANVA
jgi:hypothetical protein